MRARPRPRTEHPSHFEDELQEAERPQTPLPADSLPDTGEYGFDAETNNRYEEIKRGSIHITELQRMSVQELHEVARQEGLEEFTGLKKHARVCPAE